MKFAFSDDWVTDSLSSSQLIVVLHDDLELFEFFLTNKLQHTVLDLGNKWFDSADVGSDPDLDFDLHWHSSWCFVLGDKQCEPFGLRLCSVEHEYFEALVLVGTLCSVDHDEHFEALVIVDTVVGGFGCLLVSC